VVALPLETTEEALEDKKGPELRVVFVSRSEEEVLSLGACHWHFRDRPRRQEERWRCNVGQVAFDCCKIAQEVP